MKNVHVVFLLFFFAFPFTFPLVNGSSLQIVDVLWGPVNEPEQIIPGDRKVNLNVVVANIGNKPVCAVEAEIQPKLNTPLPITSWEESKPIKAFQQSPIQPGAMFSLIFRVNVMENATPGRYEAHIRLLFRECSATSDILPISVITTAITIKISPPPALRLIKTAWFVNGVERPVGPGTGLAVLRLYLEAPFETSINNVEAFLKPLSSIKPSSEDILFDTFLDRVPAGGVFTVEFPLVLPDDITVGNHMFELLLKFRNKYGTFITQRQVFTAEVSGKEDIMVEARRQSFGRGVYAELAALLKNVGTGPAYNVELTVRSESSKIQVLQSPVVLNSLDPGESKEIIVQLYIDKSTETGVYTVSSIVKYRDALGNQLSKDFKISFNVGDEFRKGVTASPSQPYIHSSSTTDLTIIFVNNNPYPIQEVKISISSSSPSLIIVEGISPATISSIPKGGAYSLSLKILATSQAGDTIGTLHTSIEYKDPSGIKWIDTNDVSLAVRADIDIQFRGVKISPTRVRPGETVDVAGDLVNEGSNIARAVSVELLGDPPYVAVGEARSFVGLVNPSQVSAFTLNFRVKDDAKPGKYSVVLRAAYKNGFGESFTEESLLFYEVVPYTESMTTTSERREQSFDIRSSLMVIVAIVLLTFGAYVLLRRSKKEG